jgi:hypothetical protein
MYDLWHKRLGHLKYRGMEKLSQLVDGMSDLNKKEKKSGTCRIYFHKTTQHYIPESCHLHTCCCENLKSHKPLLASRTSMVAMK